MLLDILKWQGQHPDFAYFKQTVYPYYNGRRGGFMVSVLDSGSSGRVQALAGDIGLSG